MTKELLNDDYDEYGGGTIDVSDVDEIHVEATTQYVRVTATEWDVPIDACPNCGLDEYADGSDNVVRSREGNPMCKTCGWTGEDKR